MTQGEWAVQYGVVREHVNRVLNGKAESKALVEKIDAFIAEVEAKVLAA